ncbi:hypothetical protein [Rosenbergiella collisarenosi]|uniref:hypothetical protein n=1 Tax=Rosenbergiella collisarenosi TaxID=1544695 RepID=UPI001F4EE58D|nr:hypothetical protein [Rosenbergiella collisarenosi]
MHILQIRFRLVAWPNAPYSLNEDNIAKIRYGWLSFFKNLEECSDFQLTREDIISETDRFSFLFEEDVKSR